MKQSKLFSLVILLSFSIFSMGQGKLSLRGKVYAYEDEDQKPLGGVELRLFENMRPVNALTTDQDGRYQFELKLMYEYVIQVDKPGYIPFMYRILTETSPEAKDQLHIFDFDIALYPNIEGLDYSYFDERPVAVIYYRKSEEEFVFDEFHYEEIENELDRIYEEYEYLLRLKYDSLMNEADDLYIYEVYDDAEKLYKEAMVLKPDEEWPKERLQEIDEQRAGGNEEYNKLVARADRHYREEELEEALNYYGQAAEADQSKDYPLDMIEKIETEIEDAILKAENEELYEELIQTADQALDEGNLNTALVDYQEAASIFPERPYPTSQARKVSLMIAQREGRLEEEKQYLALMEEGNKLMNREAWDAARKRFEQAGKLKPNEKQPRRKLDEIAQILEELRQSDEYRIREQTYRRMIARADSLFALREYGPARMSYANAMSIMPTRVYPRDQMRLILEKEDQLAAARDEQEDLERLYGSYIEKAETYFNDRNFLLSKDYYERAQKLFPDRDGPAGKIAEIDQLMAQMEESEAQKLREERIGEYRNLIAEGDAYLKEEEYKLALAVYEEAQEMLPKEPTANNKIKNVQTILQRQEEQERQARLAEERYRSNIYKADDFFFQDDYDSAKVYYTLALAYMPGDDYLAEKLKAIEKAEKEAVTGKYRERFGNNIRVEEKDGKLRDLKFGNDDEQARYRENLAKKYPRGLSVEMYREADRSITRLIVNDGTAADDYRKVEYDFGTFYFKNGDTISREEYEKLGK